MLPEKLLERAIAKGTDEQYQEYVRQWPSILTNDYSEWINGDGRSIYAHHREGSGVGIKPPYFGYPLTNEQHSNTHQYGLSYYETPDWWKSQAIRMLQNWINGVPAPVLQEVRTKESYIIYAANHLNAHRDMLVSYFLNPKAKPLKVTIESGKKRTNKQNAALWGVIHQDIVEFYHKQPEALAKDIVEYVLMYKPSKNFVHDLLKGLCNNNKSTASLKVEQHCAFFDRVAQRFIEKHDYELKMPVNNDGYNYFTKE